MSDVNATSEGTLTRARRDCPHPERWTAHDPQSTEIEVIALVAALVGALQPDAVIETGTYVGHMAHAIGSALAANGQGHLVTMETNADLYLEARQRCADLPVSCLNRGSLDVSCDEITMLAPGHVGFAWFDSLTPLRAHEFEHFLPLFDERTIVGFHDTAPHFGGWSERVRQHARLATIDLPTPRGCILARVL